jgi:hypothetical protein
MAGAKSQPIPDRFSSVAEAAEFWDAQDLADHVDQTGEVQFEVDLQHRTFLTALEPELAKKMSSYAEQRGVSTETLVNVWLSEKLTAATSDK